MLIPWLGTGLVSNWYHTAIHHPTEKLKGYSRCRASHGDIRTHRTEIGYKSQLDSFVHAGYFILFNQRIVKCLPTRNIQPA